MPNLAEPAAPSDPVAHHGVVVDPPAKLGDPFTVRVPDFDDLHVFQIRRWEYRGATLPATDDECLVVIDDEAEPWVPAWWPAGGDAPAEGGGSEWHEGEAVPEAGLGEDGDFYLRTTNGDVYRKEGGAWSLVGNIRGPAGTNGTNGTNGAEGRWASLRYAYLTNTEETEPAAGKLKFNAGKTSLRISETDGDAGAIGAYLAAWDDSTTTGTRGFIILRKIGTPATFAIYKVTGALVDKGTWDTLPVELIASAGAFANEDPVSVEFYRTGDKGDKGETGEKGTTGEKGEAGISPSDFKDSVKAATTANITISTALNNGDTLDGITLATGDRVLVKDQTTKKENGIWVVGVSPARATDADAAGELSGGTLVYVEQGTANGDRLFRIITNGSITPGTTEHEWAALSAAGIAEPETNGGVRTNILKVVHGLGVTPTDIQLTRITSEASEVLVQPVVITGSVNATDFMLRGIGSAALSAGQKIPIYWRASAF